MSRRDLQVTTRGGISADLRRLGLAEGQLVMLHASVKAVGWVVGGPDMVIQAILDVVGPQGTLLMYIKCEEGLDEKDDWPSNWQEAYLAECPPFDPVRTRALREWSVLTEYLRTWPGSAASGNPEARIAAVGAKAKWITSDHPLNYGYGSGSPFAKLCEVGGKVLLLGPVFESLTILHHAEHIAQIPDKRIKQFRWPMSRNGKPEWVMIEQYDTCNGIADWLEGDYFSEIAKEYLDRENHSCGKVGTADSYLFDANDLTQFAVSWLEQHPARPA